METWIYLNIHSWEQSEGRFKPLNILQPQIFFPLSRSVYPSKSRALHKQDIQRDHLVKGRQQAGGCLLHESHARSSFTYINVIECNSGKSPGILINIRTFEHINGRYFKGTCSCHKFKEAGDHQLVALNTLFFKKKSVALMGNKLFFSQKYVDGTAN